MCTVSFMPLGDGFLLTSSRDEQKSRPTRPPMAEAHKGHRLTFPKDLHSGGTWLAFDAENGRAACLLNGAFERHTKKETYRMSRGQVLLDSFVYPDAKIFHALIDLEDIEPFTLLLWETQKGLQLHEFRWDGLEKYFSEIDLSRPKLWSSATLYDSESRQQRQQWFEQWLGHHEPSKIAEFHQAKHGQDDQQDIVMRRENGLQTVSISQIRFENGAFSMQYSDLTG